MYLCIDLKSFYASVECTDRGLDPLTTNLVVADPSRTQKTICLAISPAMKKLGIRNRCRVFEIPENLEYIMAPPRMQRYIDVSADIYAIYLKYIAKVFELNINCKILYYPHPEEKINENTFSSFSNIKVVKNDYSIELISLLLPNCKKIIGFYTSALVTLQYFCPDIELQSIVVSSKDVNEKYFPIYEKCYKNFEKRGITLLKF